MQIWRVKELFIPGIVASTIKHTILMHLFQDHIKCHTYIFDICTYCKRNDALRQAADENIFSRSLKNILKVIYMYFSYFYFNVTTSEASLPKGVITRKAPIKYKSPVMKVEIL